MTFHHVLAAVDGSDHAQHAVEIAADLANSQDSRLTVLHVVHPVSVAVSPELAEYERLEHLQISAVDVVREAGNRLVDRALAACRDLGVRADPLVATGDPARVITEEASRLGVDLVVVGSRGLSDARGLLLGSVSHKVISACPTPVLVVR